MPHTSYTYHTYLTYYKGTHITFHTCAHMHTHTESSRQDLRPAGSSSDSLGSSPTPRPTPSFLGHRPCPQAQAPPSCRLSRPCPCRASGGPGPPTLSHSLRGVGGSAPRLRLSPHHQLCFPSLCAASVLGFASLFVFAYSSYSFCKVLLCSVSLCQTPGLRKDRLSSGPPGFQSQYTMARAPEIKDNDSTRFRGSA